MIQLRNHPRMSWHGFSNWRPHWDGPPGPASPAPVGELGVLTGVQLAGPDPGGPAHLELAIEYHGKAYRGLLCCDDPAFLSPLHEQLRGCLGQSVQDIGSREL